MCGKKVRDLICRRRWGWWVARDNFFGKQLDRCMFLGELSLDGTVWPVRGALSAALAAREIGLQSVAVPEANASNIFVHRSSGRRKDDARQAHPDDSAANVAGRSD
jgi:Mg-chelatase subunit ChlI-like protein